MAHGLVHAHARDGRTGSDGEEVGRCGGGARFHPVLPYMLTRDVKVKKLFRESSLGAGYVFGLHNDFFLSSLF